MSGAYKDIKHDMMLGHDSHDPWGWAMLWWFEVCDEMRRRDLEIPPAWEFRPGLDLDQDEDSYESETLGLADDDALERLGNVLQRYTRILASQGRSY